MNIVNVFLGSSFKLMYARKSVGNFIRKLNDKWMERGVRVCLKIWEDFRTEYEDKSKQDEYIDELVIPSQICVFMYDDCINPYTEKELNAKIAQDVSQVHVLHIPSKEGLWHEAKEVESKLQSIQLSVTEVKEIKQIDVIISTLVEDYIKSKGWENGKMSQMQKKTFYTTIPSDLQMEENEFEDAIRVVDDLCQEMLHTRCILFPKQKKDLLKITDHYIPFMKKEASPNDLEEFQYAIDLQHASNQKKPAITLFTKGAIFRNNEQVANLLNGKDLFSVTVRNYDTVKWRILLWLLHQQTGFLPSTKMREFNFKDKCLYLYDKPIISLTEVDKSGMAEKIEHELKAKKHELSQLSGLMDLDSIRTFNQLEAETDSLEKKLLMTMIKVINDWIFEEVRFSDGEATDIGIHDFKQKVDLQGEILEDAIRRADDVVANLRKAFNELDDEEKKLSVQLFVGNKTLEVDVATKIKDIRMKKEFLLRTMIKNRAANPLLLLSNQLYTVALFDTFLEGNSQLKEEDDLYLRILNDADEFGYKSPQIEVARLNYGNALSRKNDLKGAYQYYTKAIENLRHFPDDSKYIREVKTHVYITTIQSLASVDLKRKEIHDLLCELKDLIADWKKADYDCRVLEGAFHATCLSTVIADFASSCHIAEGAYVFFINLDSHNDIPIEDEQYHEAFCYLPIIIAGYYIDRIGEWINNEDSNKYSSRCVDLCNRAIVNARKLADWDNVMSMEMLGRAYHQLGFLHANSYNIDLWNVARKYYDKAYEIRKWLSAVTLDVSDEANLAETSVNFGALYLQFGQAVNSKQIVVKLKNGANVDLFAIAMDYAQKAVDIYGKLIRIGEEESELCYYKAIQLKGSIHYVYGKLKYPKANLQEGIKLLKEAYHWHKKHPQNTYNDTFEGVAGLILRHEGLIR